MLPTLLKAIFFPFVLLICAPLQIHAERLPLKSYTVADGLAHNEIHRIVRDSKEFLWFCTSDGLSRFDGYTFTNFGPHESLNCMNSDENLNVELRKAIAECDRLRAENAELKDQLHGSEIRVVDYMKASSALT